MKSQQLKYEKQYELPVFYGTERIIHSYPKASLAFIYYLNFTSSCLQLFVKCRGFVSSVSANCRYSRLNLHRMERNTSLLLKGREKVDLY